jgi:ubiquinone/menaquinone biosynthesis C-methylase UbiE
MNIRELQKNMLPDIGNDNEATRVAWLEKTLRALPAGITILDAGAGECQFKKFCTHLKYTSQDFGQYDGSGDSHGIQTTTWDNTKLDIVSDITSIPVPNNSFDAIMCTEVFEHIPDPVAAIKEFQRILKPDGYLIITAPFCSLTHFAPYHFSTGFNKYFYEHNLQAAQFNISEITPNGNYFKYIAQEIRRIPYVAERYSSRKTNIFHKIFFYIMLLLLKALAARDHNSSELLCFGYHVVARKNN